MRSPARGFMRHGRRPHISRIERRRGPAARYGESARVVLGQASRLAGGEGLGCGSSTDWKAAVCRVDRSDDGWAEAEPAGRGRKGAVNPSAGGAVERRVGVTNRTEMGRAAVVMMCRIGRSRSIAGQGRRGACGRRSPGTQRRPRRPAEVEVEGRLPSRDRWWTRRRGCRWPGRGRGRGSRLGRPWRGSRNAECGGSRQAGRGGESAG